MPSILIVDDESVFRSGLRKMISEIDPEWNIVGEARDGVEALQIIEDTCPDAILTDIRMPRKDGIELQKEVSEHFPQSVCVVISGYDDFMFIQQSIRSGAKDYIMKPIERDELRESLTRMKSKVLQRKKAAQLSWEHSKDQRKHVREHIGACLLNGKFTENDLSLIKTVMDGFDRPYFRAILVSLDVKGISNERYKQVDPSLFTLYLNQIITELVTKRKAGYCCSPVEDEVVILLNYGSVDELDRITNQVIESIRIQLSSLSDLTATICLGSIVAEAEKLIQSYHEAKQSLYYRLLQGGNKVYSFFPTTDSKEKLKDGTATFWEQLETAFDRGNEEELMIAVDHDLGVLCSQVHDPQIVHHYICSLLLSYYELANKLGITTQWLETEDIRWLLTYVCSISEREQLAEVLKQRLVKLMNSVHAIRKGNEYVPIERALKYIEQHYAESITLSDVAGYVHLNATYLSSLFKQRTGSSFVERLNEIRIQDAKRRMLHSDEKLANIAEQTGFTNIRHFNRVFKSATGMAPKVYREQNNR